MSQTVISVANACKELGKPIVETGCGLLKSLLGKPCEVAGEMIADELYSWQWERRIEILEKADRRIKERGLTAKVLPKEFFLNFLQHAGEIEATELQELWANLLAGAIESEANQHPAFAQILKQISVVEARVLANVGTGNFVYRKIHQKHYLQSGLPADPPETLRFAGFAAIQADPQAVLVALSHLSELGLVTVEFHKKAERRTDDKNERIEAAEERGLTAFTTFGAALYTACVSESQEAPKKIVDGWTLLHNVHEMAMSAGRTAMDAGRTAMDAGRTADEAREFIDNIKVVDF